MQRYSLWYLALLFFPQASFGITWISQGSGLSQDLYGLWGSSPNNVYVVGASGTILHTIDGGKTWPLKKSGISDALFDVWGSSAENLFAVGANGAILRSKDQGESWQHSTFDEGFTLRGIWGSGANDLYIVGEGGTILHSTDGTSWSKQQSNTTRTLHSVWGSGPNQVYAIGEEGIILSSVDQGKTWQAQSSGTVEILRGIWGDANKICTVGYHTTILCSEDNGQHWSLKNTGGSEYLTSIWGDARGAIYSVGAKGLIRSSSDGGQQFATQENPVSSALFDIWGGSAIDVYIVGKSGLILRSEPPRPTIALTAKRGDACAEGAEVFVGGESWGALPIKREVPAGRHFIEAKKADCRDSAQWLEAASGQLYSIELAMVQIKYITLRLQGTPGAEVFVDGVIRGKLPIDIERVELGTTHTLLVKKEGFSDWSQPIVVTEEAINVAIELLAIPSSSSVPTILYGVSAGVAALSATSFVFAGVAAKSSRERTQLLQGQNPEDVAPLVEKDLRRFTILSIAGGVSIGGAVVTAGAAYFFKKNEDRKLPNLKPKINVGLSASSLSLQSQF